MPLVVVRHHAGADPGRLTALVPVLCEAVSALLCCEDQGHEVVVTPEMVKVRFEVISELDHNMPDVLVEVEARAYASRLARAEAMAARLCDVLAPLMPAETSWAVWFKLCVGGWHASRRPD